MSGTADIAAAQSGRPGQLDELMLAMDVVDTLRHREDLVTRELGDAGREQELLDKLRDIYKAQGIEVPDHILKDGVKALRESRFVYTPPGPGLKRTLAELYVRRGRYGRGLAILAAVAGIGWGVWQFAVVQPERQAAESARIELTQTLPARLNAAFADIAATTTDAEARRRADALKADAERALRNGDRTAAAAAIAGLGALREEVVSEYVLTVVSRPGVDSAFTRIPPRSPNRRNYYLIVEAVAPDGRKLTLPIRNEETGETERVAIFGVRVPQEMWERVRTDKRDDGIVQFNRFGVKRRGTLATDYLMPFEGGMLTKW